jgi:hypothetical protein
MLHMNTCMSNKSKTNCVGEHHNTLGCNLVTHGLWICKYQADNNYINSCFHISRSLNIPLNIDDLVDLMLHTMHEQTIVDSSATVFNISSDEFKDLLARSWIQGSQVCVQGSRQYWRLPAPPVNNPQLIKYGLTSDHFVYTSWFGLNFESSQNAVCPVDKLVHSTLHPCRASWLPCFKKHVFKEGIGAGPSSTDAGGSIARKALK